MKEVWTDMRPLSLRGGAASDAAARPAEGGDETLRIAYADGKPLELGGAK